MGVYSDDLQREVRMERMRPDQLSEAVAACPAVYVAFGSIEWHGRQNPVGLDAVKAHEWLVGLAERIGGVVYPPVFFGAGGGHTQWPWTVMTPAGPMRTLTSALLQGFERNGFQATVLLSGHYPNRTEYIDAAVDSYRKAGGKMAVLSLVENQIPEGKGDHAALYETSFMLWLHPETVDWDAVRSAPDAQDSSEGDSPQNWMGPEFRNHPCYGLVGIDPRGRATAEIGKAYSEKLLQYLADWVKAAVRRSSDSA